MTPMRKPKLEVVQVELDAKPLACISVGIELKVQ